MVFLERFTFKNDNGVAVRVFLEAPIGSALGDWHVGPGEELTPPLRPMPSAILSAKISVVADDGNHQADNQTLCFDQSARPNLIYINVISAVATIGRISGRVELALDV